MLGVVGIHTGAYSLSNPNVNIHLFALLEIFTRFSVPIFFFVSAFGLFLNHDLHSPFNYLSFLKRRLRTVLIPYLVWSLLYMVHYTWITDDFLPWKAPLFYEYFLFGLASYQLYFLVILLWFYAFMPLWRVLVRNILCRFWSSLTLLLLLQIVVNYYSSYILEANFENRYINLAIQHRINYWLIHYFFVFILGAVCAVNYDKFVNWLRQRTTAVNVFFILTLTGMLTLYYYLLYFKGYTPEEGVNTDHQLSPIGVLYTVAATLFWFNLFNRPRLSPFVRALRALGTYSYPVYLIHPLVMYYLISYLTDLNLIMTAPVTIAFYIATIILSMAIAFIIHTAASIAPPIGYILTGSSPKPRI